MTQKPLWKNKNKTVNFKNKLWTNSSLNSVEKSLTSPFQFTHLWNEKDNIFLWGCFEIILQML